jgi:predicted nucleic acid-binding protein
MVRRDFPVAGITEPVIMELMAGARDSADFGTLTRLTSAMPLLKVDPECDFQEAGVLYKILRNAGVTIRSMNACLIAAIAWRRDATVVHADADFDEIAARYPVKVKSLR